MAAAVLCAAAAAAQSTICKYVDADGATHYTNVAPERGWKKVSCSVADDASRRTGTNGAKSPTPGGFPRIDSETQRGRDDLRRKVLSDELASEEKALGEARDAYGNGAPRPLPDEQTDAERYRQRIARLRQAVQLHERNVEALRKEIAAIK